jgi:fimbrial chaperone protein
MYKLQLAQHSVILSTVKTVLSNICSILTNIFFAGFLLFSLFSPPVAHSGEWKVTPIRLDLGRDAKTGVITVANEGEARLQVQMKAFEWSQDAEGKDVYTETNDIIFFPRIMIFEKKDEKILRAGIKIPAVTKEKAYRLFIEEIPEPRKSEGTTVAIAIKFGVPIFVKPLKEEPKGEIEKLGMSKGAVSMIVKNSGNVHFRVESVTIAGKDLKGEEKFLKVLSGWYILSGVSRSFTTEIPQTVCEAVTKVSIEIKTNKFTLNGNLDADKTMCLP